MKIIDKVKALLESDLSRYKISKDTGIDQGVLSRWSNGQTDLGAISLERGQLLADYYDAMVLNIAIEIRKLPIDGEAEVIGELTNFAPRFTKFAQEIYDVLADQDDEFAEAFRSLFDDAMQDATIRNRAMLTWVDSNFNN